MLTVLSLPGWFCGIRDRRLKLEGKDIGRSSNWDVPELEGKRCQRWRSGALDPWLSERTGGGWLRPLGGPGEAGSWKIEGDNGGSSHFY